MRLSQISAFCVEEYRIERTTACRCSGGPKPLEKSDRCAECKHLLKARADATVNRELTMLKHLFSKCVKWKLANSSPMPDVKLRKENNGRVRFLTQEEAGRLLMACNIDFRIVVLAAMLTGFRRSELRSLRWTNIAFLNGSITIESSYSKNGETNTVPLHPELEKALKALYDERNPAPEDLVFVDRYNKPWTSWRTAFENAVERAGLKDFRFHDCRHCFGSWLAMNGTDIKARMELMRHKTPTMTMRYSHLSVKYKRQAIADLPSFNAEMESPQMSPFMELKKVAVSGK
jgi:integrase